MMKLDNCRWKAFFISDLFVVEGTETTHPSKLITCGNNPRITCSATNNGLDDFYKNPITERGDVLTIDSATIGFVSYQENDFLATDHVEKLIRKAGKPLGRYVGLFIKMCIDKSCSGKYGYGYKFAQKRIERQIVKLPVNSEGNPDYEFMEEYMRDVEQKQKERYRNYAHSKIEEMSYVLSLETKKWKEFRIEDIFSISSGVRLTKEKQTEGLRPFAGATDSNNGITEFVSNTNESLDQNVLGVNYNGSVVENFYHPYETIFSDDVKRLHLKHYKDNKYVFLFMKAAILKQKVKYQYGYKFNAERMKRQFVMLPVNSDNTPDYVFMENYMRRKEYEILEKYLK